MGSTRILWSLAVAVNRNCNAASLPATCSNNQLAVALETGDRRVETRDRATADLHLAADRMLEGRVVCVQADQIVHAAVNKQFAMQRLTV